SESSKFDPAVSDRRFRIGTSDYVLAVLFRGLLRDLEESAPNISIECLQPSDFVLSLMEQGALDLIISPIEHVSPDHPSELLMEETHVVVGWSRNPVIRNGTISEEDFYAAGHVVVELGHLRPTSFAENRLQKLGRARDVDMH